MAWLRYQYWLGLVLVLPTAVLMAAMWAWRRLGSGGRENERDTRRLRQGTSLEFTIPAPAVGYVIGRHGQRVRQLEESSGARIRFKDQRDSEDKVRRDEVGLETGGGWRGG